MWSMDSKYWMSYPAFSNSHAKGFAVLTEIYSSETLESECEIYDHPCK